MPELKPRKAPDVTTRRRRRATRGGGGAHVLLLSSCWVRPLGSFPLYGDQSVLPPGTELNEDAVNEPTEQFRTELADGLPSYTVKLGDIAFGSPSILGGVARQ